MKRQVLAVIDNDIVMCIEGEKGYHYTTFRKIMGQTNQQFVDKFNKNLGYSLIKAGHIVKSTMDN